MKKLISILLSLALLLTFSSLTAFAAESATVYVTIADENGKLVLTQEAITVTDVDGDGALTINDALYAAHEAKFEGGAAAGYGSEYGSYGLSMTKLWGVENGGSYGYMLNNASAWSLADPVADGDYLNAFVYTDLIGWSDTYSFFSTNTITAIAGEEVELTLSASGYDANWNPISVPVEGATITLNGEATAYKTDAEGKVTVKLETAGTVIISATSESQTLVPPVCVAAVTAAATASAPVLEDFTMSYANWGEQVFAADVYAYGLTVDTSRAYDSITATFDESKYTVAYSYNDGAESGSLTSGSGTWLWTIPFGERVLTVTVTDIATTEATIYTFRILRARSEDDTLYVSYGGIYLTSHNYQKLQPADENGNPTGEAANVSNDHGYYYVKLAEDAAQTFILGVDANSSSAHKRYSTDGGATWTDLSSYNTEEIQAPAVVILQILSDAAYYEGTEGWEGKTARQFTIWVDGAATEEQPEEPVLNLSGSGTESDPYLLQSAADFDHLDELVTAGQRFDGVYFKVTADITLSDGWDGIGYAIVEMVESWGSIIPTTKEFVPFAGILDGDGHTLTFPAGSQPLFDCVSNATIRNLKIQGEYIAASGLIAHYAVDNGPNGESGTADDWTAIIENVTILSGTKIAGSGLLGGYARGTNTVTIQNCTIEEGVIVGCDENGNSLNASNIGGIAGDFNGTIENCTCAATVYGKDFVGGIIGGKGQSMSACTIQNTTFTGSVIATGNYVGGIAGSGYTGTGWGFTNNAAGVTIKNCTVTGSVTGGDYVGGILGADPGVVQYWDNGKGEISGNQFLGALTSEGKFVGAIIGYMKSLNVNFTISGNSYKGDYAPIGCIENVDTSCENPTAVEGTTYINTANGKPGISGMSKENQNRTDDPLGADLEVLAVRIADEDNSNPSTGDSVALVFAVMVMAAMGMALVSKKRYV